MCAVVLRVAVKGPHLKITEVLPGGRAASASCAAVRYLGNARDDIGVFAGVVFLVAAEYSHLAALQNVNLARQKNKDTQLHSKLKQCQPLFITGLNMFFKKLFLQLHI